MGPAKLRASCMLKCLNVEGVRVITKTSKSDRLRILGLGRVGITFCPGKYDPHGGKYEPGGSAWDRDLARDLDRLGIGEPPPSLPFCDLKS
jgi:hypothetical protein